MSSATLRKGSWLIVIATLMLVNDETCSFEILSLRARDRRGDVAPAEPQ